MNERWTPEVGEQYWIVAFNETVQSEWRADNADFSRWRMGNCFKTKEKAVTALEKFTALLLSLHESTQDEQLPKLTAEVFDRPDCPAWAKWAAVDMSGVAFFYENKPIFTGTCYQSIIGGTKIIDSSIKWNVTDSQNNLLERPTRLPDWCKVGEWCYCLDDDGNPKYFKITQIKDNYIYGDDWDIDYHFIRQTRLRPYNADEMRELVGKVIKDVKGNVSFVTGFRANNPRIFSGSNNFTADVMMLDLLHMDNTPCGVLEHLNENGEWVE